MQETNNDFTGDADSVVQIGALHGSINMAASAPALPLPRQLPHPVGGFVNRVADLAVLDRLLTREESSIGGISTVAGGPGIGKTALVVHWGHRVRDRFPDGDLYIDLGGHGPGTPLNPDQALSLFHPRAVS